MDDSPRQDPAYRPSPPMPAGCRSRGRTRWVAVLVAYAAGVFALSSLPAGGSSGILPVLHGDKILHFLEFALFYVLAWKAFPSRGRFVVFVLAVAYAATDELHQLAVPTRDASLIDWLADVAGAAVGALSTLLLIRLPLLRSSDTRILATDDDHKE